MKNSKIVDLMERVDAQSAHARTLSDLSRQLRQASNVLIRNATRQSWATRESRRIHLNELHARRHAVSRTLAKVRTETQWSRPEHLETE